MKRLRQFPYISYLYLRTLPQRQYLEPIEPVAREVRQMTISLRI